MAIARAYHRDVTLRCALLSSLFVLAIAGEVRAQDAEPTPPEIVAPDADAAVPAPPDRGVSTASALGGPQPDPIAVLLLPSGDVDAATTDALGELLIAAVASRGAGGRIVGKEEFQAQLGQGDVSTAECIESIPCLGRVGVALGVREVIAGTLGRRGETWAFSLNRIDLRTGGVVGRVFREVEGDLAAVVRALPRSIDDLYVRPIEPGRLVVRASAPSAEVSLDGVVIGTADLDDPVRRDLVEPGRHVVAVVARGFARYERTIDIESGTTFALDAELRAAPSRGIDVPWATWAFGALAVATLGGGIALGVSSQSSAPALSMRETQSFYDQRWIEAVLADVLYGVALAATVAAVIPIVLEQDRPPVSVSVLAGPGAAALTLSGSF